MFAGGLDFESRLFAKPDAPAPVWKKELAGAGLTNRRMIAIGTNTDPYQPDRTRTEDHCAAFSKCWEARLAPGRHRHQVGAGDA